jgi:pilus assembly protein TadC
VVELFVLTPNAVSAGVLTAAAAACSLPPRSGPRRLAVVLPAVPAGHSRAPSWWPLVLGIATATAIALVAGALAAFAAGSAIAFVGLRVQAGSQQRRDPLAAGKPEPQPAAEVPAALDVLAACLAAGSTVEHALAGVAEAFGGPTGRTLTAVAALSSWGAPVETAWAGCLDEPAWAAVARAVIRASHSGAALTDVLTHQAIDCRRALRASAAAVAQRAGVRAVLPLGLCFLPAFVLAGVVPVVAGFVRSLLR